MAEKKIRGVAVAAGEGERIPNPLAEMTFVVRSEQTDGAMLAMESISPPGDGPPLHLHTREEEAIYVVSGDFRWKIDGELSAAPPGSFLYIPRRVPHAWQNVGDTVGKLFITFAPAGMEIFFEHLSTSKEFDLEEFRAAGEAAGIETLGPPLAVSDPL